MTSSNARKASTGRAVSRSPDVAIVGMSCLFPGAKDLSSFWENILSKTCSLGDPPPEWAAEHYRDSQSSTNDRTYCTKGGYLGNLAQFDPLEFGVMPNALDGGEPDHYLTLRVAHEALLDAGYSREALNPERTEVILGRGTYINRGVTSLFQHAVVMDQTIDVVKRLRPDLSAEELAEIRQDLKSQLPPFNVDTMPSMIPNVLAGRIANRLNLMGSNYIIDAACASSLIAVELGMSDLQSGKCDMAIVGGVNASLPPPTLMIFSQLNALSRKESLRAFDEDGDGTMLGEGIGVVVLKRLADAQRDGDRIYAVLKSVGVASDGRAQGLLAPRLEGQALAIRRAYEAAGVRPDTVGLVEAHGTGVRLGDATEVQSLTRVFGPRVGDEPSCALGTVKTSIGHLLTAAGMAGLIKSALALYHRVLPPMVGCERPAAHLQLDSTPFYVNNLARPWVHGQSAHPRRAGVNAFGFGGINAHAILEEHGTGPRDERNLHGRFDSELLLFGAATREELVARLSNMLASSPSNDLEWLPQQAVAQSAEAGQHETTLAIVATDVADLRRKLEFSIKRLSDPKCQRIRENQGVYFAAQPLGKAGRVAFLFPGEGSQYPNMLADLCLHFPWMRSQFDLMDRAFVERGRSYLPSRSIFPAPTGGAGGGKRLSSMDIAAEAVFVASQALLAAMRRFAIAPDVVVGHSTGEYSALVASGMLTWRDDQQFIQFVLGINRVFEELSERGGPVEGALISVGGLPPAAMEEALQAVRGQVTVAMENCPNQFVLFSSQADADQVEAALRERGAMCMRLPFSRAYHTPHFSPFSARLREHLQGVEFAPPKARMFSCAIAAELPADPQEVRALLAAQWSSKVRFTDTIGALHDDGVRVFVEVGPRSNLTAFVESILKDRPHVAIPANVHFRPGLTQLQHLLAVLHAHHVPFDPAPLFAHRPAPRERQAATAARPVAESADRFVKINTVLPRVALSVGCAPPVDPASAPIASRQQSCTPPAHVGAQAARSAPPPAPLADRSPRATVMLDYLESMRVCLQAQVDVQRAYLQRAAGATAAPRSAAPQGPVQPRSFVSHVVSHTPNEAVIHCELTPANYPFLLDHTLGGHVSNVDPRLTALPLMPLTFSMELLAQGAALLAADLSLVEMREVRAQRWIALDEGFRTLQVVAVREPDEGERLVVEARLFDANAAGASAGSEAPIVRAELVFARTMPPMPRVEPPPLTAQRPSRWRGRDLYDGFMFHGPSLRGVASIDAWGEDGATATLRGLPDEPLLAAAVPHPFLTDPVMLDAAGQVIGYWTSDHLDAAYHVFPFRLECLRIFGPRFAVGEAARCEARIASQGDGLLRSDIDLLDGAGNVRMRLEGWWDRRFPMPERFSRVLANASQAALSSPTIVTRADAEPSFECSVLEALSPEFWAAHEHIWLRALAHLTLSRGERAQWRGLTGPLSQKVDWLMGRVAAKDAARSLLQRRCRLNCRSADIEILSNQGAPVVRLLDPRFGTEELLVSLAHSGGAAAAIVSSKANGARIGVDLEVVRELDPGFASVAFTAAEHRLLDDFTDQQRPLAELHVWCAKEAVAKALGLAGSAELTRVTLARLDPSGGKAFMNYPGPSGEGDTTTCVWLLQSGQLVLAVAHIPAPATSVLEARRPARSLASSATWSN